MSCIEMQSMVEFQQRLQARSSALAPLLLALSIAGIAGGLLAAAHPSNPATELPDFCWTGPLFSTPASLARSVGRPTTIVRVLSCDPLASLPGKSLTTVLVSYPPGAFTPAHRHPGEVSAFVISGTIRSQLGSGNPQVYTKGTGWFEPNGVLHAFAENISTTASAELLATFVTDDQCGPLVTPEPPALAS